MIKKSDKEIILQFAKKFNVSSVILFGSSIEKGIRPDDIDIGVKGIEPCQFFKFYAELFKHLSKPVDLIDISNNSLFSDLVEETGEKIYG